MVTIINYGSGNIQAIANIYRRGNIEFNLADDPAEIAKSTKLILPGVGAFDSTMTLLNKSGIREVLDDKVRRDGVPVLGICVGMQIMAAASEEGSLPGLGWFNAQVRRLGSAEGVGEVRLPHMGWNSVTPLSENSLLHDIEVEKGFYFLHTYCVECESPRDIMTVTKYGSDFASSINRDNIYGVQFHPEKSHSNGVRLLENFAKL